MNKRLLKEVTIYTAHGIAFGFLFPIISTLIQAHLSYSNLSLNSLISAQINFPLLWVIDTAPIFLGLFARAAGKKQDKLNDEIEIIEKANRQISIDMAEKEIISSKLRQKEKIIEDDLLSARTIQRSFLPNIPDNRHFNIDYLYSPKNQIGGDFLKIVELDSKNIAFFIGDVSGHGIAAALLTAATLSLLNQLCCDEEKSADQVMMDLNKELLEIVPDNRFITAIFGIIRKKDDKATFTYVRAGHTLPIFWKSKSKRIEIIQSSGMPLGVQNGSMDFEVINYDLDLGDRIFLYTDGVIEFIKADENDLNFSGLKIIFENINLKSIPFNKILKSIDEQIANLGNEDSKQDDELMLLIEYKS